MAFSEGTSGSVGRNKVRKKNRLAIDGGTPVRKGMLQYGRQSIGEDDIRAVIDVLESDWLTTGPKVKEFEEALSSVTGAKYSISVSSGTSGLHTSVNSIGVTDGDEVIVPAMTFAATANCVLYQGATPIFADICLETLQIDIHDTLEKITNRTKAIIAVDFAGLPCDYTRLREIAQEHELCIISDACHSIGGKYKKEPVGSLADISVFSFHPVKTITTGEGGAITTDNIRYAEKARRFRNHGIDSDHRQREKAGSWFYEMQSLGFNYRLSDIHCALGLSQLRKLEKWISRRNKIAKIYNEAFRGNDFLETQRVSPDALHAYHLYVVLLNNEALKVGRKEVFGALRAEGIGVNVHYVPVHLHPFYQRKHNTSPGMCPNAEAVYERILSIPIFPMMSDGDVEDVVRAIEKVCNAYSK